MWRTAITEALQNYRDLRDFLSQADFSDPENYAELLTRMDMQSFIDWMCTNIYIANTDTKPLGRQCAVPGRPSPLKMTPKATAVSAGSFTTWTTLWASARSLATTPAYAFDSFTGHAVYAALRLSG